MVQSGLVDQLDFQPNWTFFFIDGVYSVFWDFLLDTYLVIAELYNLLLNSFFRQVTTCWPFSI